MKGFLLGIVAALAAVGSGVYLVSHFGWYPIGADNAPGRLEHALASRAMDVYADRHKPDGDNPVAPTEANLTAGAKAYETHCALCHGGAAAKISPMRDKFSPPAPQLINKIPHDEDAWLFWVTKHGVRMTGMPSWTGVLSDEEMWGVIAFIKHSNKLPPTVEAAWRMAAATGAATPASPGSQAVVSNSPATR